MIVPKMGMKTETTSAGGLAAVLFTPVQQRVLGLLFGQPDRTFQGAELIRLAGSGTGAVHRFLTRLAESGLVNVERVGNQKHYRANPDSPIFHELHGLITKTSGLVIPLRKAMSGLADRISSAFVYGSVAKGLDKSGSDVDLMIIGERIEYADVFEAIQEAERELGRTISANVMTPQDWRRKKHGSGFAARISGQPRLFVIGDERDID